MKKVILIFTFIVTGYAILAQNKTDSYTDTRDGKKYKTLIIGEQTWMAENLAHKANNGNYWLVDDDENNLEKYGYLYDWETAKKAVPPGWHLPTKEEFLILLKNYGGEGGKSYEALTEESSSGFNGLFTGFRDSEGNFISESLHTGFWSASVSDNRVWILNLNADMMEAYGANYGKNLGFSVRCMKNSK